MQDKTTVHETTYAQNNSVALKKKKGILQLISLLSLYLSTLFTHSYPKILNYISEGTKKKKVKKQIFKLSQSREVFCAHVPTLSHQMERKICFLTCGNTLSTGNRQVRLVRQSICILLWIPTQWVTSSTKAFDKNKSGVAALSVLQSVSIDKLLGMAQLMLLQVWYTSHWCSFQHRPVSTSTIWIISELLNNHM